MNERGNLRRGNPFGPNQPDHLREWSAIDRWLDERARENGLRLVQNDLDSRGIMAWYFDSPAGTCCVAITREDLLLGTARVAVIVANRFANMLREVRGLAAERNDCAPGEVE